MALSGIDNPKSQIKKWADKLKDIVCILLNCTKEQLENRDFKEKELGEEWWYWKLDREGGYSSILLPYNTHAEALQMYEDLKLVKLTPRLLMQLLGTDCGRNIIHPNIWVNALMSEYRTEGLSKNEKIEILESQGTEVRNGNWDKVEEYEMDLRANPKFPSQSNWIITDTRFPNELQAVKNKEGISIKVIRPDVLTSSITGKSFLVKVHKKEHESETALDKAEFDYVVYNTGTIEDLIREIKGILIQEKIIQYGRT
jgi:hypothetical protein